MSLSNPTIFVATFDEKEIESDNNYVMDLNVYALESSSVNVLIKNCNKIQLDPHPFTQSKL